MYVSLHNRTAYSFGSASSMPEDLVTFAAQHRMPAIALTDLDGMYAAIPFYQSCRTAGVKAILGAEFVVQCATDIRSAYTVNLTLLARGMVGYGNLCRLVSLRHLREEPLSIADLAEYSGDLVCLVGDARPCGSPAKRKDTHSWSRSCENPFPHTRSRTSRSCGHRVNSRKHWVRSCGNPFPHALSRESLPASLLPLRDAFPDRLYVELCIHDEEGTAHARRRAGIADELGIPVVAGCESRCIHREDGLMLRALQSVGTLTLLDQPHPDKPSGTWHLRTPEEMQHLFRRRPDALANTLKIAEQCSFSIDLDRNRFPASSAPPGKTAMQHLRDQCVAGCKWRYVDSLPQKGMGGKRPTMAEALARLDRELTIIEQVHYAEYFLVFHEIVQYCRSQGISSLARGSAADSLVCFALGVSHACPFRFDLPFDRFLNPERAKFSKMADIDLDLPWDQRDQVIRWVFDRWGHDRVAMIGLPNTFHARAAVAELGKVFGLPAHEVHKATRMLPRTAAWNAEQAITQSPEARDFPVTEEPYRTILQLAAGFEGLPHHWATHPCGIVVAPEPLTELVPVQRSPKDYLVAQYDMDAIEALGFIKIDLLGQAGLSVLRDAVASINEERTGISTAGVGQASAGVGQASSLSSVEKWSTSFGDGQADDSCSRIIGSHTSKDAGHPSPYVGLASCQSTMTGWKPVPHQTPIPHPSVPQAIDLQNDVDYADEPTWQMIATGGARGVHHIESPAMTSLIRQCDCRDIDCLTAVVAIIRPGAANQGKKELYARRHQGFEPPQYVHPSLVPVLEQTYGLMVFEEHILQIATEFAGMNLGRADVLRRGLNKENRKLIDDTKAEFWQCARALGRREEEIAAVWAQVEGFRGFMFNKAHSAEYAVEAFQGAWLKHRWPAHYLAAILSNYRGFYANSPTLPQILYVMEALRLGIGFLPPCVNRSGPKFRVERLRGEKAPVSERTGEGASGREGEWARGRAEEEDHAPAQAPQEAHPEKGTFYFSGQDPGKVECPLFCALFCAPHLRRVAASPRHRLSSFCERFIRIPVTHINGLAEEFIARYLAERERGPFESLDDFLERCTPSETEAVALLDSGALDGFDLPRPYMFWQIRRYAHTCVRGHAPLRPLVRESLPAPTAAGIPSREQGHDAQSDLPPVELTVPDAWQVAQREMELLGFPVTIDPLTFLGHTLVRESLPAPTAAGIPSRDLPPRELTNDIDWSRYVPLNALDQYHGRRVTVCGLMIADRINLTTGGDLMKFVSLADRTGVVEAFLFPDAYKRFGHLTTANPILAATGIVEPFENRNGFNLRVEQVAPPSRQRE